MVSGEESKIKETNESKDVIISSWSKNLEMVYDCSMHNFVDHARKGSISNQVVPSMATVKEYFQSKASSSYCYSDTETSVDLEWEDVYVRTHSKMGRGTSEWTWPYEKPQESPNPRSFELSSISRNVYIIGSNSGSLAFLNYPAQLMFKSTK
ncbi:hypothetical protein L1987_82620 [Smallanthus sonchifolius]|uniref:Uncharacterized protein n=1 Tax=Smallanthus sonchifolius TaxID=185202 RepID=A0ACB8YBQ3_9ASTR|nr:hypothetical protein L1987_82620 [Smallanthus sonchifolius]